MARKRRTSIRTAAGTASQAFLRRIQQLHDEPTIVLPEIAGEEPAALAKLRTGLHRLKTKGPGFFARRDKGVLGAVAHAMPLAKMERATHLLDAKVGGARRFYMQRGHVPRMTSLGVQNHDDPLALLMAYRPMAKQHGLHFFARPGFWCTGTTPSPPEEWIEALGRKAGWPLQQEPGGHWGDGRTDGARVLFTFRGGPSIATSQAAKEGHWHQIISGRYAGPHERRPVEIQVQLPDGTRIDADPEDIAAYRGAVKSHDELVADTVARWREGTQGQRFILGDQDFGDDQEAFLDALGPTDWERKALARMTAHGHQGAQTTVAGVLSANADRLEEGVGAFLADSDRFIATHRNQAPREVLRKAALEAEAQARVADLPRLEGLGPVGAWVDGTVRAIRREGRAAGLERVRRAMDSSIPRANLFAFVQALGGALDLEARFQRDEKQAGGELVDEAKALMEASGESYVATLKAYITASGSGEQV